MSNPSHLFSQEKTYIMGIVNRTPDSFSDGGRYTNLDTAVHHALHLVKDGADVLDIGGESTRPGFDTVTAEEEIERVVPLIKRLADETDVPISVDTYKAEVAEEAVKAGAAVLNDVWAGEKSPSTLNVAKRYEVPIILMHNQKEPQYTDVAADVCAYLQSRLDVAREMGIPEEHLIVDPGIGFGKTFEHNITVLQQLEKVVELGVPVLLGTSRKRFIGHILGTDENERMEGTLATVAYGIQKGCHIMRVHDVKEAKRLATVMDILLRKEG
ncbi:dihydropteroate synthase [Bacillus fonticola]|uniref:dihydropteroate synthase n=1 Tax=Bacillus fonticola TaxID=2728853 RepID=UPI0014754A5B|nr:dihydropteroate synthase [Bacillus fonticola]